MHYTEGNEKKEMKRLHVIQQNSNAPRKDFYFCENCANVLAMTFGKQKTQTQKSNVCEEQTPKQEAP
jgi:hypothetical protein